MTPITNTVREQGFLTLECDIPEGQTLREWSAGRRRASVTPRWRDSASRATRWCRRPKSG